MGRLAQAARMALGDVAKFSQHVVRVPLRGYQVEPLRAVVASVLGRRGREFLLVFPRQSGKNEAVAQLLVYLLNLLQWKGGTIVYGAVGDTVELGIQRLESRLENGLNAGRWVKRSNPRRRCLGRAEVVFLSSHPAASARGHTAHWLLVLDETQDQDGPHVEAVFTPMRAANNATALYIGTVKLTTDFLWQKKQELEAEERRDGVKRVWMVPPEQVTAENPSYEAFLQSQVRKHGRHHPIVASEYFLEPIDGTGGLFDARRRALMAGTHGRLRSPEPGHLYVATLDVAGEDEAPTGAVAQLANPGRDYTVATVFDVVFPSPGSYAPGPTYRAVDVFADQGSKHFASCVMRHASGVTEGETAGGVALVERLRAWLEHWQVAHLVADDTGVGAGVVSWLTGALGANRVTGFTFSPANKAGLGSAFLALVETGRFRYFCDGETVDSGDMSAVMRHASCVRDGEGLPVLSDSWWFFAQCEACAYEVPADGQFDRQLRWGVPAGHKTPAPGGSQPTHDDRLISAALVAELDRLLRAGRLTLGMARSAVVVGKDPVGGDVY